MYSQMVFQGIMDGNTVFARKNETLSAVADPFSIFRFFVV